MAEEKKVVTLDDLPHGDYDPEYLQAEKQRLTIYKRKESFSWLN